MYAVRITSINCYKASECVDRGPTRIMMKDTKLDRGRKSVIILKGLTKCMT